MADPYQINFTNYSSTPFYLNYWGDLLQEEVSGLSQTPGDELQAEQGLQSIAIGVLIGEVATGDEALFLTWYDPSNNWRFGVKMYIPVQVFGIGRRPHWYVSADNTSDSNSEPNWIKIDDPSSQYNWSCPDGYQINATPISEHDTLTINVIIQDS